MSRIAACRSGALNFTLCQVEIRQEIPTIGFNTESADYKTLHIDSLSAGGRSRTRPLYAHYYKKADAFVFCFDASDEARFEEVKMELEQRAKDELLQSIPVLILANKADKKSVPETQDMIATFDLENVFSGRKWRMYFRCTSLIEKWNSDSRGHFLAQISNDAAPCQRKDWMKPSHGSPSTSLLARTLKSTTERIRLKYRCQKYDISFMKVSY
jgi:GTPase SAR1 family protein